VNCPLRSVEAMFSALTRGKVYRLEFFLWFVFIDLAGFPFAKCTDWRAGVSVAKVGEWSPLLFMCNAPAVDYHKVNKLSRTCRVKVFVAVKEDSGSAETLKRDSTAKHNHRGHRDRSEGTEMLGARPKVAGRADGD
jgi:hypothetical protein